MRRLILKLFITFTLAVLSAEGNVIVREPVPIVLRTDFVPTYGRKKTLQRHFKTIYV